MEEARIAWLGGGVNEKEKEEKEEKGSRSYVEGRFEEEKEEKMVEKKKVTQIDSESWSIHGRWKNVSRQEVEVQNWVENTEFCDEDDSYEMAQQLAKCIFDAAVEDIHQMLMDKSHK